MQLVSAHASTREALQDALPRLQAMFAESGLQLGDASVSAQMPQQERGQHGFEAEGGGVPTAALAGEAPAQDTDDTTIGLVDAFV